MDETLQRYEEVKKGESTRILDEEEFERVIEYYFQESNEEQALLACDIARTYYPFSASVLLLRAEILTQAQKYGQALKALDEMEQYDGNNIDAVLLRSDILLAQFKYDQAALWLEQRSKEFEGKEKTEVLLELSDVYDESEEFDAVFDTLKRVIAIDRRNEEALQKICFWSEFTGRLEESVTLHTQLTDDDPYNALGWFNLGAAAVLMFFVMSGYVIGLSIREPLTGPGARRYVLRRTARLVPVAYAAILLAWLLQPDLSRHMLLGNFLFLQNDVPYPVTGWQFPLLVNDPVLWTLNYEAFYYLLFLVVWWLAPSAVVFFGLITLVAFGPALGLPVPVLISRHACGAYYWMGGLALAWCTAAPAAAAAGRSQWPSAVLGAYALWVVGPLRLLFLQGGF